MMNNRRHYLHLDLICRDHTGNELISFLRQALPYYRSLPGLSVRLLRSEDRPGRFLEVIEYESAEIFQVDQVRVVEDEQMKRLLSQWRDLLVEPARVEHYQDISHEIFPGAENGSSSPRFR